MGSSTSKPSGMLEADEARVRELARRLNRGYGQFLRKTMRVKTALQVLSGSVESLKRTVEGGEGSVEEALGRVQCGWNLVVDSCRTVLPSLQVSLGEIKKAEEELRAMSCWHTDVSNVATAVAVLATVVAVVGIVASAPVSIPVAAGVAVVSSVVVASRSASVAEAEAKAASAAASLKTSAVDGVHSDKKLTDACNSLQHSVAILLAPPPLHCAPPLRAAVLSKYAEQVNTDVKSTLRLVSELEDICVPHTKPSK